MAAFGLEAAKYLAENYLDESHAADFMSAMEMVAKYGLNGSVSDGGKVIYNVQEGQVRMSGAPGNYVDMEGWLKANDTELYNQINELNQSIINHKDGENHSAKFIELYTKAAKKILDASPRHGKGQRLCRLEGESGKDQAAGHIPECEIQRLPVFFGKPAEPEQPFQFMDQRERKPLYEMAGGLM